MCGRRSTRLIAANVPPRGAGLSHERNRRHVSGPGRVRRDAGHEAACHVRLYCFPGSSPGCCLLVDMHALLPSVEPDLSNYPAASDTGAAALTLVFWILFVSLQYTRQVAQDAIDGWHREVESDPVFHRQTKQRIYYMVKATNQEDFRKYPAPETVAGEALVPVSKPGSKKILASVIANEALKRFRQEQPFLSEVLSLPERIPDAVLVTDMTNYFAARPHGGTYPFNHALDLTADQIKARLDPETPRVVVVARLILTGCFLLAQAIPFCLIGLAATRDLKVST
jgi:hypothetical protein